MMLRQRQKASARTGADLPKGLARPGNCDDTPLSSERNAGGGDPEIIRPGAGGPVTGYPAFRAVEIMRAGGMEIIGAQGTRDLQLIASRKRENERAVRRVVDDRGFTRPATCRKCRTRQCGERHHTPQVIHFPVHFRPPNRIILPAYCRTVTDRLGERQRIDPSKHHPCQGLTQSGSAFNGRMSGARWSGAGGRFITTNPD